MTKLNLSFLNLIFFSLFLLLTGCQSITSRGQFVSDDQINQINKGHLNKEKLVELIGSPTYVADYSKDIWYYIHRSEAKRAWFDPKIQEQRIVKISFSKQGDVTSAKLVENTHSEDLNISSKYTKTYGTDKSGIQKFVKNIGRFNQTTNNKKSTKKKKSN